MIIKSEEQNLNNEILMAKGEPHQPTSARKVALRDLPNGNTNIIADAPRNTTVPKDTVLTENSLKFSGIKRHMSDSSTSLHRQSSHLGGTTECFVYTRRKLEAEPAKLSPCCNLSNDAKSKKSSMDEMLQSNSSHDQVQGLKMASSPAIQLTPGNLTTPSVCPSPQYSSGKHITGVPVTEAKFLTINSQYHDIRNSKDTCNLHWKDRFLRLQAFLNTCDQSNQEDYIQMLRSLSAAGRSMHAVELEKRAIHLLLEEGRELHRMKALDVLGKGSPTNPMPFQTYTVQANREK